MIELCTLTRLDAKTDLARVADMSARYPFLEFGVLLSRTPQDKDSRYPEFRDIERIVCELAGRSRIALHVCGRAVGEFVKGASDIEALVSAGIGRIQINFDIQRSPFTVSELDEAISRTTVAVITQDFPANASLASALTSANHQVLYDTSGGRGVTAKSYAPPFSGKATGYAGGIGPENVREVAASVIGVSAGHKVWIDMENRLRSGDYLDLDKCDSVACSVAPMIGAETFAKG